MLILGKQVRPCMVVRLVRYRQSMCLMSYVEVLRTFLVRRKAGSKTRRSTPSSRDLVLLAKPGCRLALNAALFGNLLLLL